MAKPELKAECIRLRTHDRLSLKEIAARTGAPQGTLSYWLQPFPLTDSERQARAASANRYAAPKKDRGVRSQQAVAFDAADLTRAAKGRIADAATRLRLVRHGFEIYSPMSADSRVDLVVRSPLTNAFASLQVRWAKWNSKSGGMPCVSLMRQSGHDRFTRFAPEDFDFLVGYDFETDVAYVFSHAETSRTA